jgi:hypothetical protein
MLEISKQTNVGVSRKFRGNFRHNAASDLDARSRPGSDGKSLGGRNETRLDVPRDIPVKQVRGIQRGYAIK